MKLSPLFTTSEEAERPIPDNQEPTRPVMSDDKISPLKIGLLVSPVFIFGVLFILSSVIFPDKAYEPVWLLPILNLIFLINQTARSIKIIIRTKTTTRDTFAIRGKPQLT